MLCFMCCGSEVKIKPFGSSTLAENSIIWCIKIVKFLKKFVKILVTIAHAITNLILSKQNIDLHHQESESVEKFLLYVHVFMNLEAFF